MQSDIVVKIMSGKSVDPCLITKTLTSLNEDCYQRSKLETVGLVRAENPT